MDAIRITYLICDGCKNQLFYAPRREWGAAEQRAYGSSKGWINQGAKDYCCKECASGDEQKTPLSDRELAAQQQPEKGA